MSCLVMHKAGGILVSSSCIMRRGEVGSRHEHDDDDSSYIREFHMLVRYSCLRCKGTAWPDVSRYDLPLAVTRSYAPYETESGPTAG